MISTDEERGIAYCTVLVSQTGLAQGNATAALAGAGKALGMFESRGERRGTVRALAAVVEAQLALDRVDEVIEVATAALEDYADAGDAGAEERLRAALEEARRRA